MSTDTIVLPKDEHKEIRKAYTDFKKAGENATRPRASWSTGSSSCSRCTESTDGRAVRSPGV